MTSIDPRRTPSPANDGEGDHSAYTTDILARIGKVRAALDAVKRLGQDSDPTAHGQFGVLVEDMESYLGHLRQARDRAS